MVWPERLLTQDPGTRIQVCRNHSLIVIVIDSCVVSGKELNDQLESWLTAAGKSTHGPARAIIAP